MKIGRRLKAAAANLLASPKAESFRAGGKLIECRHCENILFHKRRASLNTAVSFEQDLAPGLYLVNMTAGEHRYTERLVIQ